jgi:(p)ppGpp synthase/HD superfamily hydrolase
MDSLKRIKLQPKEVWAVKMADRICNLYAPPFYWNNEKKIAYQKEAQLILSELKEGNSYLAERLQQKIEKYNQYIES